MYFLQIQPLPLFIYRYYILKVNWHLQIKYCRPCIFCAFQNWLHKFNKSSIFRFFESSQKTILHYSNKFFVTQLSILWNWNIRHLKLTNHKFTRYLFWLVMFVRTTKHLLKARLMSCWNKFPTPYLLAKQPNRSN